MKIEEEINGRFRNEYHKGLINLTYTVKHLSYDFLQTLKKYKITEPQYNVLKVLHGYRTEGPSSIGFLKERMLDQKSDVSRIVDKLYEKGHVDRKESIVDRRQKDVEITEKGLELLASMSICDKTADSLLTNLSESEVIELNRLLDKIRS